MARTRIKKFFSIVFFFLGFLYSIQGFALNACNDGCTDATQCGASCPVCAGTCIACTDLYTQVGCEDAGTGASTACVWSGGACAVAAVPEFPRFWIWGLAFMLVGAALLFIRLKVLNQKVKTR